jgi:hypothetical protein
VDATEAMELSAVARIVGTDPGELLSEFWSAAGEGRGGLSRPRLRPAVVSPRPGWRRRVRVAKLDEIGVTIDLGGRYRIIRCCPIVAATRFGVHWGVKLWEMRRSIFDGISHGVGPVVKAKGGTELS